MKPNDRFSFAQSRLVKSIVFSGSVLIILSFIILRYEGFFAAVDTILKVFRPLLVGLVIAFALNTPFSKLERRFCAMFRKLCRGKEPPKRFCYVFALLLTYVLSLSILTGIICIIVPQLISSVSLFAENFDSYYKNLERILSDQRTSVLMKYVEEWGIEEKLRGLTDYIPSMLAKTLDATTSFVSALIDFVIGLVFSIYILADKRALKSRFQRLFRSLLSEKHYRSVSNVLQLSVQTFTGFLTGQLLEAFFIGTFCFIGMQIFGFEYAVLISVIIGLTNVIPIVGPIIGTIPCSLILLLVAPRQVVWFIVYVICLQQLESNLLYPRVVGNSVGLPALWVLAAVTIGGGLGGVGGMVVGIPLCSIVYAMLRCYVLESEAARAKKEQPEEAPNATPTTEPIDEKMNLTK